MMKFFISPLGLLLLAGIAMVLVQIRRDARRRRFHVVVLLVMVAVWLLSTPALSNRLAGLMVPRVESLDASGRREVVVVLAGGSYVGMDGRDYLSDLTTARVVRGAELFQKLDAAILVVSGRGRAGNPEGQTLLMRDLAKKLGVPAQQIVVEPRSRNTFEHPTELLRTRAVSTKDALYIVTDAVHLRRALIEFRRQFPVVKGVPATAPSRGRVGLMALIPQAGSLEVSTAVMREWIGIGWYATMHRFGGRA